MTILLNGTKRSQDWLPVLHSAVKQLEVHNVIPKLVVLSVGHDEASSIYVTQKEKRAKKLAIQFEWKKLPKETSQSELHKVIESLNEDEAVSGIILQLPLPDHLNPDQAIQKINPNKDVDGFHPVNLGLLMQNQASFVSCTPLGIIDLLQSHQIDLTGKNVTIVGRSQIVGLPLSLLMTHHDATVTLAHSKTKTLKSLIQSADIVVMAAGNQKAVSGSDLKAGSVLVDVSIHRNEDGSLQGDIDPKTISKPLYARTPVPGGVGPMTVIMLMKQTIIAAAKQHDIPLESLNLEVTYDESN